MRDISDWSFLGYGEMSTLKQEDLLSPDRVEYVMKYPRKFDDDRVNWEDVNEIIAAEIAKILGLKTVSAEIAYRNGNRGCLMIHFINQYNADSGETGAALLSAELGKPYDDLKEDNLPSIELVEKSFSVIESLPYFQAIKHDFVAMNIFDLLIGNQDRHPFNWQILFKGNKHFFGPLYDNGASLGWQLPDLKLQGMLDSESKMNKYFKNMKVKSGLFENTQPPLKSLQVLSYCIKHYQDEIKKLSKILGRFDMDYYENYIDTFPLISSVRKQFLIKVIEFRIGKILSIIKKEAE